MIENTNKLKEHVDNWIQKRNARNVVVLTDIRKTTQYWSFIKFLSTTVKS